MSVQKSAEGIVGLHDEAEGPNTNYETGVLSFAKCGGAGYWGLRPRCLPGR